jgi:membrane protein implicated in regulation of membrane protease activity
MDLPLIGHLLLVAAGIALVVGRSWPMRISGICLSLAGVVGLTYLSWWWAVGALNALAVSLLALLLMRLTRRRSAREGPSLADILARCEPPAEAATPLATEEGAAGRASTQGPQEP